MKEIYYIGLGPEKFVSAELRPYHKGWMVTRIFGSEKDQAVDIDLRILEEVIIDADIKMVILYLDESIWVSRGSNRYVHLGFQVYSGVPRRRPEYQGGSNVL